MEKQKPSRRRARGGCIHRGWTPQSAWLAVVLCCATTALCGWSGSTALAAPVPASDTSSSGLPESQAQPLRVSVWQDKREGEVYQRGEDLRVHFETNQDAYGVVYRIDTDGEVTILWPQSRYDDGFVFGDHQYDLPAAQSARLRASDDEGVEYVEALVSLYPFDLRNLEVDFHNEANDQPYAYRVAGDPFLAMNEINFAVTGLEDPDDYVVTDYTSYYVHRAVDHPRYLCSQCHDDSRGYDPYGDTCTVSIYHDFGWSNRWYLQFGCYPAYYYPVYYYVDPWTYRPWVNYWYTPWYRWPYRFAYAWPYDYYLWYDSPYYWGDCYGRWSSGHRRYAPLSRLYASQAAERETRLRRNSLMVKGASPSEDLREAMRTHTVLADRDRLAVKGARPGGQAPGAERYRDTPPAERTRVSFPATSAKPAATGLRLHDTVRSPVTGTPGAPGSAGGTSQRGLRLRDRTAPAGPAGPARAGKPGGSISEQPGRQSRPPDKPQGGIRSVEPRKKGTRIWSGGRTSPAADRTARPRAQEADRQRGPGGSESPQRQDKPEQSQGGKATGRNSASGAGSARSEAAPQSPPRNAGSHNPASVRPSAPPSKPSGGGPAPSRGGGSKGSSARGSASSGDKSRHGGRR